jgi:hypothetical protein
VRQKRYEDLEPEVIKDKVTKAKFADRSKHMDEWSMDDLAAWFYEMKMPEYIPFLYTNRWVHNISLTTIADVSKPCRDVI